MKILIADDEEIVRNLMVMALRRFGHAVLEASDIPQVWSHLEANPDVGCVIVDENMRSTMTGSQFSIAARDRYPKIRIVIATGGDICVGRHKADAFLLKPFGIPSLKEIVRNPLS